MVSCRLDDPGSVRPPSIPRCREIDAAAPPVSDGQARCLVHPCRRTMFSKPLAYPSTLDPSVRLALTRAEGPTWRSSGAQPPWHSRKMCKLKHAVNTQELFSLRWGLDTNSCLLQAEHHLRWSRCTSDLERQRATRRVALAPSCYAASRLAQSALHEDVDGPGPLRVEEIRAALTGPAGRRRIGRRAMDVLDHQHGWSTGTVTQTSIVGKSL